MKKFYITTSIAYTNASPHIGFALEMVQADVLARYHRFLKEDVFFSTGTDEHGAKIAIAAEKAGQKPKEFVDKIAEKYKKLKTILNISADDFIRTTDKKNHWPNVKKVWLELKKKGDIYKKDYQGFYCSGCEAFITKKDLAKGKCSIHQKKPKLIKEENYFFRFSKYLDKIKKLIEKEKIKIIPETRKNELLGFIKQGLEDVSFSRPRKDLKWGIPVPGDSSQTIYVWADALTNYLSVLGYSKKKKKFQRYWPADLHCVGKDILKFHGLIWTGMLLSLGLKLPKTIFVHGFISVNGKKMSKSLGNVVDPFKLVKKYGAEALRYYLLREIASTEDGDFTYQRFEKRYNSDLAGGIGNLLARVRAMAEKYPLRDKHILTFKVKKQIEETEQNYKKALKEFKFNQALKIIWNLISFCDKYIEKERPWEDKKNSPQVIANMLIVLENIAEMIKPFLPETGGKILKQIERDKLGKFKDKKREMLFSRA